MKKKNSLHAKKCSNIKHRSEKCYIIIFKESNKTFIKFLTNLYGKQIISSPNKRYIWMQVLGVRIVFSLYFRS